MHGRPALGWPFGHEVAGVPGVGMSVDGAGGAWMLATEK
eukprot:CAMPEP_0197908440 /NCGR_PEP_ID=MMETSP1439-20131203/66826_1 /TAXON_ID=66791 /ORGANISM="Gonyaulax spinifera, Strain CCMP409" /LENGTH=38 /DNA_ID= /DNA_START= /DNA_END= /DNA_ORIENTATION=